MRTACLATLLTVAAFLPAQTTECRTNGFGSSCGPELTGRNLTAGGQHQITFQITDGLRNAPGIWVFGLNRFNQPIPIYGCDMHISFSLLLPFMSDGSGAARATFTLPGSALGTYYVQAASFTLSPNAVFVSNGLQVECRR